MWRAALNRQLCCAVQLFTLAFMSATLFVKTRMSRSNITDAQRYVNYLFFASFFYVVNGFSELPIVVSPHRCCCCVCL